MTPTNLATFLLAYCFVCTALSFAYLILGATRLRGFTLLSVSATGLAASVWLGAEVGSADFLSTTITALTRLARTETVAFAFGFFSALPLAALAFFDKSVNRAAHFAVLAGVAGTILSGSLITGKDVLSKYLPNPNSQFAPGPIGSLVADGFVIQNYADTELIPIRIAFAPNGRLYVSGHRGIAAQSGAIVELVETGTGQVEERLVAAMLNRPYGLVASNDALYVSRSGQYTRWRDNSAEQISTGAVTMLRDLDDDGVMDYYHDVVTDLPGAKAPDYLHQNNGLALDSDGNLYITTANHADGDPVPDPLAGTILKATGPDFEDVVVYANGLRNPFGLVFAKDGRLIATDNDAQTGRLGGNLGDKLIAVSEGDFFGHPYAPDDDPRVTPPLLRSSFALGGLTLTTSPSLPPQWRDSVFVVVYGEGRIMKVEDQGEGEVTLVPFATVPGAVDVASAANGDFYVAVYPDNIVRIKFVGSGQ